MREKIHERNKIINNFKYIRRDEARKLKTGNHGIRKKKEIQFDTIESTCRRKLIY